MHILGIGSVWNGWTVIGITKKGVKCSKGTNRHLFTFSQIENRLELIENE